MIFRKYLPDPRLTKQVACYWTLEISGDPGHHQRLHVLAEGLEFCLLFEATTESRDLNAHSDADMRCMVYGPMTQARRIKSEQPTTVLGICFRPGGAYPFFSNPMSELRDFCVDIDDLWGTRGSDIMKRMQYDDTTMPDRIRRLETYLTGQLHKIEREDACVSDAVTVIDARCGRINIEDLADRVGLSNRQLERSFKERVGMSPKQLCRSLRFKSVFNQLKASPAVSWGETAAACGYYDQSHMIRDFKHYTGQSPAAYFAEPRALEQFLLGDP